LVVERLIHPRHIGSKQSKKGLLRLSSFNPSQFYDVFRNVKLYGAIGDGITDDTAAIKYMIEFV